MGFVAMPTYTYVSL